MRTPADVLYFGKMTDTEFLDQQYERALETIISRLPDAQVVNEAGVKVMWGAVEVPFFNHALLSGRVRDAADLERRMRAACKFATGRPHAWIVSISHDLIPSAVATESIMAALGLYPAIEITGMYTDAVAGSRATEGLEIRRIESGADGRAAGVLNCRAYDMPVEWGDSSLGCDALWTDDTFGYVGYVGGEPVSTTTVLVVDGVLYVACVATAPGQQRKGYGDAVMRHALAQAGRATGISRTALHATEAGRPVYERMGYRPVNRYTAYMQQH